jgi:hypothetical protein
MKVQLNSPKILAKVTVGSTETRSCALKKRSPRMERWIRLLAATEKKDPQEQSEI